LKIKKKLENNETEQNFSMFIEIPNKDQQRQCYKAFYDATSNAALQLQVCPVCVQENLATQGEWTSLLSDPSVRQILTDSRATTDRRLKAILLNELLERRHSTQINCWMCFDCKRALQWSMLPKLALANNLVIGEVPYKLKGLTVPEQLLIARHYPRCYIFKLYPREYDRQLPTDYLYNGMAGNASLFKLNTQEVVKMLKGQKMPSPVASLASILAITFIGKRQLPMDWIKKTFRVRQSKVYDALMWLHCNNPIYADINVDRNWLEDLPEDDVPEELLLIVKGDGKDLSVTEPDPYPDVDINDQHMKIAEDQTESEIGVEWKNKWMINHLKKKKSRRTRCNTYSIYRCLWLWIG
jgi:hypothetical protein